MGAVRERGDGPQGSRGADAAPSDGLAAALKRLDALERAQTLLRARNLALRQTVRALRAGSHR